MTPRGIEAMLEARPFQPFKIVTSNNREYEIRRPEMVVLAERVIIIRDPHEPGKEYPESFQAIVGLSHINAILPLAA